MNNTPETWQTILDKYREWILSEKQNTLETFVFWLSSRYEIPKAKDEEKF